MTFEEEVKKTSILKDLPRMIGTGGNSDYFAVHTDDRIQIGVKLEMGITVATRIRIMKNPKIDIYSIVEHVEKFVGREKVKDQLKKDSVKGSSLAISAERASFMVVSNHGLQSYGGIETPAEYLETMENYRSDLTAIGNRIYASLTPWCKRTPTLRKQILAVLDDFTSIYHPPEPKGMAEHDKNSAPGKAKAVATVTDITKGKPKADPKK